MKINILVVGLVVVISAFGFMGVLSADASIMKSAAFYKGMIFLTVDDPVSIPGQGVDSLYQVTNGVSGQPGILSRVPGDGGYNDGRWAVYTVMFITSPPYLLTSELDVLNAEAKGDVVVKRAPELDNLRPIES